MENTIGLKININPEGVDLDKVSALCGKFLKKADKIDANPNEVGAAIATLQEWFFDEFGGVPMSESLLEMVNGARMFETKEA